MVIIKEKISVTRGDKVSSLESKLKSKELDLFLNQF